MKWRLSSRTARKCTSARTCSHTRARLTRCSYSSTMLSYGVPHGDTAMALTVNSPQLPVSHHDSHVTRHTSHVTHQKITHHLQVGVPAAIATQLLLDGRVAARGVVRPMDPAVYEPMLSLLEAEGIIVHEKRIA